MYKKVVDIVNTLAKISKHTPPLYLLVNRLTFMDHVEHLNAPATRPINALTFLIAIINFIWHSKIPIVKII